MGRRRTPQPAAPIFPGDLPITDEPLPRFLDDAAATKLLRAARADPDPFVRLAVEFLARTGMRKGELLDLTVDAVVQIGSAYWLRVPVGKLHNDRYIPLHPQLKELLDDWLAAPARRACAPTCLFIEHGRRDQPASRVDRRRRQGRPRRRDRPRHPAPAPSHPGHPGHQPRHVASRRSPPCSGTDRCP